jgi:hypothetical protein
MTEPNAGEALDFQRAQFDAPPPASLPCQRCKQPLTGSYFSVNGHGICANCLEQARAAQRSSPLKALLLGSAAGALGALVYYAIRKLSGYDLALVTIIVGVAVGIGVRMGAGGSQRIAYRLLAVGLTYVAMCSTYVPQLLQEFEAELTPFSLLFALAFSLAVPGLHIANGEVLAVLIFGFGLWEAWRLSAPRPFVVEGPFTPRTEPGSNT